MILTINGKTIQTFGAHRLVQGENRPEPITFRVTMPKASEMSWYLGYKRQDGTGEEAVSLEVSQASGNVDDLYLTWYPSRTATHVPGKLGIIVYGLQANVTPEGGDRRWSTYPTQLIIAQGQTVESAEPVDPSVFEQALIDLTALVEQALGIKTDVQALKEEAGAYLAQIITLASEVEANAIKVAALEGSAKASAESAAESATEAGRKATIAETASNMASESASRANEKAGDASASATLAREYKNDAQSSAENAQAGARAAEQSASSAQESAERAERVGIEADRVIAEVEAVGEEKKQQINTEAEEKIGEIIAEGATQVEAVRGVYQEDLGQLTSSLTEVTETVDAHDALIDETSKTASDNKARLHGYDFRKVDENQSFVLDGDGEASLKQMMDSVEEYPQDAIMLSLEPIIPTASQHNFGIRGQIACDDTYLYVCTAENQWKKIPLQNL